MKSATRALLPAAMVAGVAALVALDQWTKTLAATHLAGKGTVSLLGDFAVLVFVRNQGAFLSLGSDLPPVARTLLLLVLPLGALAVFAWIFLAGDPRRAGARRGAVEYASVTLIAAGGVGNLIDRLAFGDVRDFLNFGIGSLRTGIMNLADLYILAALIVIVATAIERAGKTRG